MRQDGRLGKPIPTKEISSSGCIIREFADTVVIRVGFLASPLSGGPLGGVAPRSHCQTEEPGSGSALLQLIQDLRVVINGHISSKQHIHASVPQGSLIPEAQAYADDCTLAFTCDRRDWQDTVCRINLALDNIVTWSSRWQVSLTPDKTQALLIYRRQDIANLPVPDIQLEGRSLPLQSSISILGVEFDVGLTFTSHARRVA
ncbi:hypothetical protein GWK47_008376 [Chionoecetes opilio]|uniref:Reverse transcriptase domain-containing protein n=1 Tax=Chionoecetes opilio TaxID=41210 RepID=A0A8J4XZB1_CHIOP|nr:hypothetical protein GWK47_008376 [Chionoecetes opilio]